MFGVTRSDSNDSNGESKLAEKLHAAEADKLEAETVNAELCGKLTAAHEVNTELCGKLAAAHDWIADLRLERDHYQRKLKAAEEAVRKAEFEASLSQASVRAAEEMVDKVLSETTAMQAESGEAGTCCVCQDAPRNVLLRPCLHLAMCSDCARKVDLCPLCRKGIEHRDQVLFP